MQEPKMMRMLQSFLQMFNALNQELETMRQSTNFIEKEACLLIIDEIRLTCSEVIRNLHKLEQRLIASDLMPPS